jgi:YD repeat-containing protein
VVTVDDRWYRFRVHTAEVAGAIGLGRIKEVHHPSYARRSDPLVISPVEYFDYDKVGNKIFEASRRGQTTTFDFDSLNRPLQQTDPGVSVNGDGTGGYRVPGEIVTEYDWVGNATAGGWAVAGDMGRVHGPWQE